MPDFGRSTLRVSWIVAVMFWVAGATEAGQGAITAGEPQNVQQETPTSVGMIAAVRDGDHDAVRSLLAEGWDVNAAQGDGMTALHWAVRRGDVALGEALIYAGGDVHAGTRIGRYTPLHMAARGAHVRFVTLLLEANADPNAPTLNSGASPLHLAAASGDPRVVTELIRGGATVDALESAWS